jgi:hypothetical protein
MQGTLAVTPKKILLKQNIGYGTTQQEEDRVLKDKDMGVMT